MGGGGSFSIQNMIWQMILVYFWDIFGFLREKKFKDGGQPLAKVKTKHPIWPRLPLARLLGRVRAGNMGGVWVKGWA